MPSAQTMISPSRMRLSMDTSARNVPRAPQGRGCQSTAGTSLPLKQLLNASLVFSVKLTRVEIKLVHARFATLVMSTKKLSKLVL